MVHVFNVFVAKNPTKIGFQIQYFKGGRFSCQCSRFAHYAYCIFWNTSLYLSPKLCASEYEWFKFYLRKNKIVLNQICLQNDFANKQWKWTIESKVTAFSRHTHKERNKDRKSAFRIQIKTHFFPSQYFRRTTKKKNIIITLCSWSKTVLLIFFSVRLSVCVSFWMDYNFGFIFVRRQIALPLAPYSPFHTRKWNSKITSYENTHKHTEPILSFFRFILFVFFSLSL